MNLRNPRVGIWAIWGMVAAYAFVQTISWAISGGIPRRPLVLVQVVGAWVIMLILGVVSLFVFSSSGAALTGPLALVAGLARCVGGLFLTSLVLMVIAYLLSSFAQSLRN